MPKHKPQLDEVSLNISDLECTTFNWKVPGTKAIGQRWAGLIVFSGFYRRGSAGEPDARFIRWRIEEFADLLGNIPSASTGLVVDLRTLDYVWGDNLTIPHLEIPVLVVIPSEAKDPEHYKALKWAVYEHIRRTDIFEAFGEMSELIVSKIRNK